MKGEQNNGCFYCLYSENEIDWGTQTLKLVSTNINTISFYIQIREKLQKANMWPSTKNLLTNCLFNFSLNWIEQYSLIWESFLTRFSRLFSKDQTKFKSWGCLDLCSFISNNMNMYLFQYSLYLIIMLKILFFK